MEFNPIQTNTMPIKYKILNLAWCIINCTLFRFTPPFSKAFKIYRVLLVKAFGGKICWNCYLHPSCKIEYPWNLTMGKFSSLGEKSWIYALDKITIGEKCCIGKEVYLLTGSHNISKSTFDLVTKPIFINDCTWIATRSSVLPGVNVGKLCVIGTNSVITKDIENGIVVAGNPAKFIKKRIIKEE